MKIFKITLLSIILLSINLFANSVATITAIKGLATIERDKVNIKAALGDALEEKDRILTQKNTRLQIIFKDETIISIGKNSNFLIEEYLFEKSQEPIAKFGMLKGAIRVITGKIGKVTPGKFIIQTKTATIGIRGTNFTIVVEDNGSCQAYCTYGAITVTVNGKKYTVKQGFFISISSTNKIEIKAFTPKDLKNMKKKNFGIDVQKRSGVSKSDTTNFRKDEQLDNTRVNTYNVFIKDITDQSRDIIQITAFAADEAAAALAAAEAAAALAADEATAALAADEATAALAAETADTIMNGYNINYESTYITNATSLYILDNGLSFDSANSWIKDTSTQYDARLEIPSTENWQFTISSTPINYTSKEDFSTTFSDASVSGGYFSNARITTGSQPNSFVATPDDLANDDYMSWGSWSVSLIYDNGLTEANDETRDIYGLWVAGEPTNTSVVDALTGSVSYDGIYRAIDFTNNDNIINGTANMLIDFGADSANLTINYGSPIIFDMSIVGNSMTSTQENINGYADGTFYGPSGDSVGGSFLITDDGVAAKGVYQVTAQ